MSTQESCTAIQGLHTLDPDNPKLLDISEVCRHTSLEISVSICKIKLQGGAPTHLEDIFAQRIELSKKGYDGLTFILCRCAYTPWSISDTLTHIAMAIDNLVKGAK